MFHRHEVLIIYWNYAMFKCTSEIQWVRDCWKFLEKIQNLGTSLNTSFEQNLNQI